MDADRREAMTGAAIDRELQALVAVDPSPQFLARVRTRIADQPAPSESWMSWTLAGVAAAAVAVVVAAALSRWTAGDDTRRGRADVLAATALPNAAPTISAPERRVVLAPDPEPRVRSAPAVTNSAMAPAGAAEPDVLIDARESSALRALIAGVRAGRVDLAPVLSAAAPSLMNLPAVTDIAIPPIAIDPLEQGVRQ